MMNGERLCAVGAARLRQKAADGPLAFRGRLIAAGEIRNVLDRPAGLVIPSEVLETAVDLGQFENLACFIDHAGLFDGPSLRDLFGVWSDIVYNVAKESVEGTLTIYDTLRKLLLKLLHKFSGEQQDDDVFQQIMDGAETPPVGAHRDAPNPPSTQNAISPSQFERGPGGGSVPHSPNGRLIPHRPATGRPHPRHRPRRGRPRKPRRS